jgi:hypothetical protein
LSDPIRGKRRGLPDGAKVRVGTAAARAEPRKSGEFSLFRRFLKKNENKSFGQPKIY